MISLRMVGTEVSALGAVALSMPLRFVVERQRLDPTSPHPPVVLIHGFLGDPTNLLVMRRYLAARGVGSFATFAYAPRLDYQRLACRLGEVVDAVCLAAGVDEVDVVGHSLGGLVARYLVEMAPAIPIRRLVTLGAPYFASCLPVHELAIFGAADPFIAPPHPDYGPYHRDPDARTVVVPQCGHWGLLYHPTVLRETADFLCAAGEPARIALEAAS